MIKLNVKKSSFYKKFLAIAIPIFLQNLSFAGLSFLDVFMVGQLGKTELVAVGIGNQIVFLFIMFIFSVSSGTAIFTSQYWGKKDIKNIQISTDMGFLFTLTIAVIFTFIVLFFTKNIAGFYSTDPFVLNYASKYIKIISITFILMSISFLYSAVLKSTEKVKIPVIISITAVLLNTILNYMFIFGKIGCPELGIEGAAIATVIARTIETSALIFIGYIKSFKIKVKLVSLYSFSKNKIKHFIKIIFPVIGQSMGWALGFNMYNIIYGRISTESLAAYNIARSIEQVCLIVFVTLGSTCAIMVGNKIGATKNDIAIKYSKNFIFISIVCTFFIAITLFFIRNNIIEFYNIDKQTKFYLFNLLLVMSIILIARALNIIYMMGILKAGGDTTYSMLVDSGGIWLIGVPIAFFAAFVFNLPVYIVMALASTEEFVKVILCSIRFFKNKWIKNLTLKTI